MDLTTISKSGQTAFGGGIPLAGEVERLRGRIQQFQLGEVSPLSPVGPVAVSGAARPVASPARRMLAKVAGAVGLAAGAASASDWEEF